MSIGKKIVVFLVTAVAIWAGATAYISSSTKSELDSYLEKRTALYANNGMNITLLSFTKGFMHSYAEIEVDFTDPKMHKNISEFIKLPIVSKYEIENGPLLFKNGFSVGASRMHTDTNISEMFKDQKSLQQFVKESILLNSTMKISFDKKAVYHGEINANQVTNLEGDKFELSPIIIDSEVNIENLVGTFKLLVKEMVGTLKDNAGGSTLENITFEGELTKFFENGFYLGNFDFSIEKLSLKNKKFPFELKDAQANIAIDIAENCDNHIDFQVDFHLDKGNSTLPKEINSSQQLLFSYGIRGATLKGMMAFQDGIRELQKRQSEVMEQLSASSSVEEQMKAMHELQIIQLNMEKDMSLNLVKLIDKNTTLFIQSEILDTKHKRTVFDAEVTYVGDALLPSTLEAVNQKFKKELLNLIKVDIEATLQKSFVLQLPTNFQSQLQMAVATGMLKKEDSHYLFNLLYIPRKLTINGADKSGMLPLLEMGLQ